MRYCIGYEDKERDVDTAGFQTGQAGWILVRTHAVAVDNGQLAATSVCTKVYSRVNVDVSWFDSKFAYAVQRCTECEKRTQ